MDLGRLSPSAIAARVSSAATTALDVAQDTLARLAAYDAVQPQIWSSRAEPDAILSAAKAVDARIAAGETLPLAGVPFAVKDNIDVAGLETTAGCPAFAYAPDVNASVIDRLLAAGAICVGKTNLDQFATGLVGTRSPYGIPANASAVALARVPPSRWRRDWSVLPSAPTLRVRAGCQPRSTT